jgi:tetratricopeptide (TPR) repeat protein
MEEELMPQCTTHEPQIFYLKTSGEFYEKLSEPQKAKQHFEKAVEIANTLAVTHPTRLMAILDLAQLVHRQNEKAKAAEILSDVLVAATKEVKLLSGEEAKESQKAIDVVQGQLDKWNK